MDHTRKQPAAPGRETAAIDVNEHDRFVVTRRHRITASPTLKGVDLYDFALDEDGTPPVCHVEAPVERLQERIVFYAGEGRTAPLMHLNPLPRFDPWARHELTDSSLATIGAIRKAFGPRRGRSHYVLYHADGDETARIDAHIPAAVTRRRVGRLAAVAGAGALGIPVIGAAGVAVVVPVAVAAAVRQMRESVDPVDVASELFVRRGDERLGVFRRFAGGSTLGRRTPPLPGPWGEAFSGYDIDMRADAARTVDRRLVLALAVALDALRGVVADPRRR